MTNVIVPQEQAVVNVQRVARETTMTNAVTTVSAPLAEQLKQAEWFARSGFMPKHLDSAAKVYAVVTLGQELGLGPWAAINNIYLAGNKPTINTNLMLSLIQASGLLEHFDVKASETNATVTMARRGVGTYTATFSIADANTAGLTTGYNAQTWKKYPRNMLKARAISDCARTLFADVLLGMYTPEELGARVTMNESGDIVVIDAEPPRHTDTETGEIVTVTKPEPAPAPPTDDVFADLPQYDAPPPPPEFSQQKAVIAWVQGWNTNSVSSDDLLAALGVTRFRDYAGTFASADQTVREFLTAKGRIAS